MRQLGEYCDLARETSACAAGQATHRLDGDRLIVLEIDSLVNGTHATAARERSDAKSARHHRARSQIDGRELRGLGFRRDAQQERIDRVAAVGLLREPPGTRHAPRVERYFTYRSRSRCRSLPPRLEL